ncbi:MAG: hypothetical protein R2793_00350 [Flavobacteriaceae bacterium]
MPWVVPVAISNQQTTAPKGNIVVTAEAVNRSNTQIVLQSISSEYISFLHHLMATP